MFLTEINILVKVPAFSETWYHDHSNYYQIPGYQPFMLNCKQRRGGGVAMYARAVSTASRIEDLTWTVTNY